MIGIVVDIKNKSQKRLENAHESNKVLVIALLKI